MDAVLPDALTLDAALRMIREHAPARVAEAYRELVKDKSYQEYPMGQEAAAYLRSKRKRLTDSSFRGYEGCLDKLARQFPDLELQDFELPVGAERLEEFLDDRWGDSAPGTYNVNHAYLTDFFRWQVKRGRMHSNPTTMIERAKAREVYRTTFSTDQRRAIIASAEDLRDRIALRLLFDYGIRKGALRAVQFKHFDHQRKRLTIFTKGRKVRELPIPHPAFWFDLERHLIDAEARPSHYLMCLRKQIPRAGLRSFPDRPLSSTALHRWWYARLEDAGIVAKGETSGERMHKARHTAGQRVLDKSGNLKAVQKLLGHASIQTTGDIYADWDLEQLATTMRDVLAEDDDGD
jgi:site-specific recombinase XerC